MPAGTPTSRIVETINAVETIQRLIADLTEAVTLLSQRVEALERSGAPQSERNG